jgi:hypothetical protein
MADVSRRKVLFTSASMAAIFGLARTSAGAQPPLDIAVRRDPGCGCCEAWTERLKAVGFNVTMTDDPALDQFRAKLGVPVDLYGCHTAIIGSYVIEGHVPPADILRFLGENRQAMGLSVPGMPVGSPGMESGAAADKYDVLVFKSDGSRDVFASY